MKILTISLFFIFATHLISHAQFGKGDNKYTLGKLTQEQISKGKQPIAAGVKESKDTTFTTYNNASVGMRMYFVNPKSKEAGNSTGVYLNSQRFSFYCDVEKAFRQNTSNFLDIYEFAYLGKKYLAMVSLRDDCSGGVCNYKCYNLFDITNPRQIVQTSFASIHGGKDSFGDYNFDGIMDFVRVMPKDADNAGKMPKSDVSTYTVTAYTIGLGAANQLKNKTGQGYYILAKGDSEVTEFEVIQHDWMIPLKGGEGKVIETVVSKDPVLPFDPKESVLYDMEGKKVEKSKFSLQIDRYADVEGALKFCEELRSRKFTEVFLLPDQYNKKLYYYVLIGNYDDKLEGQPDEQKLKKIGMKPSIRDFSQRYSTTD